MSIAITQRVLVQGTKPHLEDACGAEENYVWALDGATSLSDDPNDRLVSEFVRHVDAGLHQVINEMDKKRDLVNIMRGAIVYATTMVGPLRFDHDWEVPSFAFVLAKVEQGVVEVIQAADVAYRITDSHGSSVESASDFRFSEAEQRNRDAIARLEERGEDTPEARRSIYRETRATMNTDNGYPVGSYDGGGLSQVLPVTFYVEGAADVEMWTDGWQHMRAGFATRIDPEKSEGFDDAAYIAARIAPRGED